jgi:hypothetical protein
VIVTTSTCASVIGRAGDFLLARDALTPHASFPKTSEGEMKMRRLIAFATVACLTAPGLAGFVVEYDTDAGGNNPDPLNGLSASSSWEISGNSLTIALTNTSTGAPAGAEAADSLLVSLGFNLVDGVSIVSGNAAVIGAGSTGLGAWDDLGAGDSVAEEWLWTNEFGGGLLAPYSQVISTSSGQSGGIAWGFDGSMNPKVNGPYGGIAADPPTLPVPPSKKAVSDTIVFSLTLSDSLSASQLALVAESSMVEFGSDFQYLTNNPVPAPAAMPLLALGVMRRRRRRG